MRNGKYTGSEEWTEDNLDRLFWIEIAKRKTQIEENKPLQELIDLRRDLEGYFNSKTSAFQGQFDGGEDIVLDAVQFRLDVAEVACKYYLINDHNCLNELQKCLIFFEQRILPAGEQLTYTRGFRWADFTVETDLISLHHWWNRLISSGYQKYLGTTKGVFSGIGETVLMPNTFNPFDDAYQDVFVQKMDNCPIRIPHAIWARNFFIGATDEHHVAIDQVELEDKLILAIDLNKPLPSMHRILAMITLMHGSVDAIRNWDSLKSGIMPSEEQLTKNMRSVDENLKLITRPKEERQQVTSYSNVWPLIRGLLCWDLVKKDGLRKSEAYRHLADKLECDEKSIENAMSAISEKIDRYSPSQLPWWDDD